VGKQRIQQWEQQPEEPEGAFAMFQAYLNLPRHDRSVRQAISVYLLQVNGRQVEVGESVGGGYYELADKWQWKDRARAYDREADRKIYAQIEAKRAQMMMETFDFGRLLRERAAAAARMLVPVTQTIGERDGMAVVLVETKMTPADISRMAQVGLELEQLSAGNPTVDSAKGELVKRIREARKRREAAEAAAEEAGLE
jgi:hypothetical protein